MSLPSKRLSRRQFAATAAAGAAAWKLQAQQLPPQNNLQQTATPRRRPEYPPYVPFEEPLVFRRREDAPKVRAFPMKQVRVNPGAYKDAQDWNIGYLHRLPVDRLVHNCRVNHGLPSSAEPLGGWEEPKVELRGHFTGHFLSACALAYSSTGDHALKAKGDEIVAELAKCQRTGSDGYLSAFPREFWDRLKKRERVWAPFYTIHKIMAGMLDMYEYCANRQALEVVEGMAGWADQWTAPLPEEQMQDILNTEYGGMNDLLYKLAVATGDDRWGRTGDRYTKKKFFNPLALRRDELRGLHVNTHVPQVIGAARRYELTGERRFYEVADFFWHEVTAARSYVTGGTSNGEAWLAEPRRLAAELQRAQNNCECCCVYNMLKLTRHLYAWDPDPRYFDYYERVMLNHRLGTIYPQTGATMYYLPVASGAWKTYGTEDKSFWCCTGTGVEEFAKLNDSIYFYDDEGIYVNQFIASEVNWPEKGIRLRQDTSFPHAPRTTLLFTAEKPVRMTVHIRVPAWLAAGGSAKLNGRALEGFPGPGSYLTLTRVWKTGDRMEMEMPMSLHFEAMPDDPAMIALLYGPLVLAGDLGPEGLTKERIFGPNNPRNYRMEMPALRPSGKDLWSAVQPGAKPLAFRATGQDKEFSLAPLNSIVGSRYTVYWRFG